MGGVDAAVFHALKCLRVALLRAFFMFHAQSY